MQNLGLEMNDEYDKEFFMLIMGIFLLIRNRKEIRNN